MCKTSILGGDGCADASKCVPWFQRTHGLGEARTRRDPSNDAMMAADGTLSCCTLWRRFGHCSAESLLTGHCRELARRDGTQVTQPRAGAQSPHRASTVSVSPLAAGCRRSTALALMVKQRARQYRSTWEAGLNYGSAHCLLTTVCPLTRHLWQTSRTSLKVSSGIMCRSSNAIIAVLKSQTNRESNLLLKTTEMKEIILFKQLIFSLLWKNNMNLENDFHRMDSTRVSKHVESPSNQKLEY